MPWISFTLRCFCAPDVSRSRGHSVVTRRSTNVNATFKLTKRAIDAATPQERRNEVWDAELKGFGVRIEPSGLKTFILRYRAGAGGRRAPKRFVNLGKYGAVTPDEARRQAREHLGTVARGAHPGQELARQRSAPTLADAARRFMAEHLST